MREVGAMERSEVPLRQVTHYQQNSSEACLRLVVVELGGCGDREHGQDYEAGWDKGVTAVSDQLVAIADRTYEQRGQAASALQPITHLRQQERARSAREGDDAAAYRTAAGA
ncbi:hypothetical protein ABIA33_004912 [Streptacidiphilus sp. MAP12-16]|uniref:hypothetical protein n=1 Tax=Streptacidiphilus sp. MAP12-16 TaxID=3156300 RepID=UPI003513A323